MAAAFDRDALLDAFDQIGRAAAAAGMRNMSSGEGADAPNYPR